MMDIASTHLQLGKRKKMTMLEIIIVGVKCFALANCHVDLKHASNSGISKEYVARKSTYRR